MVDGVAVPDPLERGVSEPEDEYVLDRLLAQVVVDPEYLRFMEHLVDLSVQLAGRRQVVSEGLLHDDARVVRKISLAQAGDGVGQRRRRDSEVDQPLVSR